MDRLDCQFIMFMCTSVHLETFVRWTEISVSMVMSKINQLSSEDQQVVFEKLRATLNHN